MDWGKIAEYVIGSVPAAIAVALFLRRIDRHFSILMIEHEILMGKYAKDAGIDLNDLPTRTKGIR